MFLLDLNIVLNLRGFKFFPIFLLTLASGVLGQETSPQESNVKEATQPAAIAEGGEAEKVTFVLQEYVKYVNSRDFERLVQLLSPGFTYADASAEEAPMKAEAMVERLNASVEQYPALTLSASLSALNVNSDTAEAKGEALLQFNEEEWEKSQFSLKLNRVEGEWKLLAIEETVLEQSVLSPGSKALKSLTWLMGRWAGEADLPIVSVVEQIPEQPFLRRTFFRVEDGQTRNVGTEIIGYDPKLNLVRSWTFFSDGSFGNATWHGGDDHWQVRRTQTLADGSTASGVYTITPLGEDSLSVKLISREVDGEPRPAGETVVMSRAAVTTADESSETKKESTP